MTTSPQTHGRRPPNVLTIAGSDPSGGAGIQADLKTFSALGAFGTSVITALTAQSTRGVTGVHAVAPEFITAQLDTLLADVRIDAVKIGMVASPEVAKVIADALDRHRPGPVVLDPVMVAKGGDPLVDADAMRGVRETLLPRARVITPNRHEAAALLGIATPTDVATLRAAARALAELGADVVVVKGGGLAGEESVDVLWAEGDTEVLTAPRVATRNVHGTGCTLSSAIAALIARGADPRAAVREAKAYVTEAIARADVLEVGGGHGPVHHFHRWW
ncbi:MAG: bifunctional hydroxymethylpyrimidine kinase/phosphomethylpyrimidine kinase [Ectothiorhodospiraceae bacterium]|nr:bifunctional hydroxymethylpyrimidine kinase/phosphomethylpyrimidine kinase [Chromatiales bacterium]MCP5155040.1 bifunctional hydroxymethylpyrimidine kinase/phosphomethylpyrimidine kinase [Ectothiorhodospiraceae bacterium]